MKQGRGVADGGERSRSSKRSRRRIDLLVMHCGVTPTGLRYCPQLVEDHKRRGFCTAGYHYVTLEGDLFALRDVDIPGNHAMGYKLPLYRGML